jgi:putative transposase
MRSRINRQALDAWARSAGPKPFWKPRAYDFNVIEENRLHEKLDYMHKNPTTRGLVDGPHEWRWSSYQYYQFDDDSIIQMDWDGSWPIV